MYSSARGAIDDCRQELKFLGYAVDEHRSYEDIKSLLEAARTHEKILEEDCEKDPMESYGAMSVAHLYEITMKHGKSTDRNKKSYLEAIKAIWVESAKGTTLMKIGRYQTRRFADILAMDPDYCAWASNEVRNAGSSHIQLVRFATWVDKQQMLSDAKSIGAASAHVGIPNVEAALLDKRKPLSSADSDIPTYMGTANVEATAMQHLAMESIGEASPHIGTPDVEAALLEKQKPLSSADSDIPTYMGTANVEATAMQHVATENKQLRSEVAMLKEKLAALTERVAKLESVESDDGFVAVAAPIDR